MADKAGARTAAAEYNAITDTETDAAKKRQAKLREIFGGCGSNPARIIEPHSSGAIDSDMQDHER